MKFQLPSNCIIFGIGCIIFGLVNFLLIYIEPNFLNYASIIISVGFGFISIGLASISICISKESKRIAEESKDLSEKTDEKIDGLANSTFLSILASIDDSRWDLEVNPRISRLSILRIHDNVLRANEIMKHCNIDKEYYHDICVQIWGMMLVINKSSWKNELHHANIHDILSTYEIIRGLKIKSEYKRKITIEIKKLLDIEVEITDEFMDTILRNLLDTHSELCTKKFVNVRDRIIPS